MDTTKEYILQCEKAWADLKRDIYFSDVVYIRNKDGSGGWIVTQWVENSPACFKYEENKKYPDMISKGLCQAQNSIGFVVWKQDQLQKMADINVSQASPLSWVFAIFVRNNFLISDYSMEQLWLAFVMKEKYQKTWNGKEWVK